MKPNQEFISFSSILPTINCYNSKLQNLKYDQNQPKSAVAIIIKKQCHPTQGKINYHNFIQDQILFLQRKKSPKDRFSGEICFPGGRQQPSQNLIHTAIRQTFQQTNIQLKKQNLIGCIDRQVNFIIYKKKKPSNSGTINPQKQMVVYAFVFYVESHTFDDSSIKINKDEIETYKWVKVTQILTVHNLCWFDYTDRIKSLANVYSYNEIIKQHTQKALLSINRALSPSIDIKMGQKLYGITLYILMIILVNFSRKIESLYQKQGNDYSSEKKYLVKQMLINLKQIKQKCDSYFYFELNDSIPITEQFRKFEKALFNDMYKMRPKL